METADWGLRNGCRALSWIVYLCSYFKRDKQMKC